MWSRISRSFNADKMFALLRRLTLRRISVAVFPLNPMHLLAQAAPALDLWPFFVLLISVGIIVVLITVLRVHAFFALILAALAAGLLAKSFDDKDVPASLKVKSHWIQAVELTTFEMGNTAGKIGVVIALA